MTLRVIITEAPATHSETERKRLRETFGSLPGIIVSEVERHPRGGYLVIFDHEGQIVEALDSIKMAGYSPVF